MSHSLCSKERAVILANQSGQWSEDLRRHVSNCTDCAETVRVAGWLGQIAQRLSHEGTPPHPTLIWIKAQLEQQQRKDAIEIRRAAVYQALARFAVGLAVLFVAALVWPAVKTTFIETGAFTLVEALPDWTSLSVLLPLSLAYGLLFWRFRGAFSRVGGTR